MTPDSSVSNAAPVAPPSEMDLHCTPEQAHLWLRGLLTMAWADGEYDPQEKALIDELIRSEWPEEHDQELEPISPADLAAALDPKHAEDFLRTAVMAAVADGLYSETEDQLLHEFCAALQVDVPELSLLRTTLVVHDDGEKARANLKQAPPAGLHPPTHDHPDLLKPIRSWMEGIDIQNPKVARFLCRLIPSQCPFERDVVLFDRKLMHIPPMCKLNPLYEQVVSLRFRALSYLADECGEDVTPYIQG